MTHIGSQKKKKKKSPMHNVRSVHETNLTCAGTYTQQIHKISFRMFRHSLGAIFGGVFTLFKVVFSKWSSVCSTVTHLHHVKVSVQTQEEPLTKCSNVKQ
jgi:hypothetical protein